MGCSLALPLAYHSSACLLVNLVFQVAAFSRNPSSASSRRSLRRYHEAPQPTGLQKHRDRPQQSIRARCCHIFLYISSSVRYRHSSCSYSRETLSPQTPRLSPVALPSRRLCPLQWHRRPLVGPRELARLPHNPKIHRALLSRQVAPIGIRGTSTRRPQENPPQAPRCRQSHQKTSTTLF